MFLFLLANSFLFSQNVDFEVLNVDNQIKRFVFETKSNSYPVTVSMCPIGDWEHSIIRLGHHDFSELELLSEVVFGYKVGDTYFSTSKKYDYDTLNIDTIKTLYNNLMCTNTNPSFAFDSLSNEELKSIEKTDFFHLLEKDIKYTILLDGFDFPDIDCDVIRCVYPIIIYDPFKTTYAIVDLFVMSDSIRVVSNILKATNILSLKGEKIGDVILKRKDARRLISACP